MNIKFVISIRRYNYIICVLNYWKEKTIFFLNFAGITHLKENTLVICLRRFQKVNILEFQRRGEWFHHSYKNFQSFG